MGDRNTKYFHCLASYRRMYIYLDELLIDNIHVSGNDNMSEKAQNFFQWLFTEEFNRRLKLDGLHVSGTKRDE